MATTMQQPILKTHVFLLENGPAPREGVAVQLSREIENLGSSFSAACFCSWSGHAKIGLLEGLTSGASSPSGTGLRYFGYSGLSALLLESMVESVSKDPMQMSSALQTSVFLVERAESSRSTHCTLETPCATNIQAELSQHLCARISQYYHGYLQVWLALSSIMPPIAPPAIPRKPIMMRSTGP